MLPVFTMVNYGNKERIAMDVNDANDQDLGQVNGGATELWTTDMQCSRCGYEDKWSGNYERSTFFVLNADNFPIWALNQDVSGRDINTIA